MPAMQVTTDYRHILAEIVDRCLEADASRRFANAQSVLDALPQ
jgi:hypothetical protein